VALDSAGNIFVADSGNYTIREISTAGIVSTVAGLAGTTGHVDGTGSVARFKDPENIAIDSANNIYVADGAGNVIRKLTEAGVVTTFAGSGISGAQDGTGLSATFNNPTGIAVDAQGNVYVADYGNNEIREITPAGVVTTIAGSTTSGSAGGTGSAASFDGPAGLGVDSAGNVYVADSINCTIRKVDPTGYVTTIGGSAGVVDSVDGLAPNSRFDTPADVTVDSSGIVYVADALNCTIRRIITGVETVPFITVQPTSVTVTAGESVTFAAGTAGGEPLSFQWNFNGSAISGATAPTYTIASVQQANAGTYTLTITNSDGSATSSAATLTVNTVVTTPPPPPTAQGRLVNISSRALVQTGAGITIAGFVIDGPAGSQKQVLIRGIGPGLNNFGIAGFLAAPTITLLSSSGTVIDSNTGWLNQSNSAAITAADTSLNTFALSSANADSAMIENLSPGSYTVELAGVNSTTGVGLVEVYELNSADASTLVNISTRAQVGTGADILIAGFVVHGTAPAKVLIRGVGPTLSNFSVSGVLAQPVLTVFDSTGTQIATNTGGGSSTAVAAASASVSAFALNANAADSGLVLTLSPGTYTAQVSGLSGTTGVALVEVYQLP
jgi:hypothetical protein